MDTPQTFNLASLWPLPLGLLVVILLYRKGCFRTDAMDNGPQRNVGLGGADLIIALGLMIVGISAQSLAVSAAGLTTDAGGLRANLTAMEHVYLTLLGQSTLQLPTLLYLAFRATRSPHGLRLVGLLPTRPLQEILVGVRGLLAALPLVFSLTTLMVLLSHLIGQPAPELSHKLLPIVRDADSRLAVLLLGAAVVIVAPILEEAIYRGLVQTALAGMFGHQRRWLIVLFAASLFAFIHVSAVSWHALPALFALGVLLGWLYEKTGSLWPSIVTHAGFNLVNFSFVLLLSSPDAA